MVHQSMQYNCFDYKQVHELVFSITCLHSAYTDIQFFLKRYWLVTRRIWLFIGLQLTVRPQETRRQTHCTTWINTLITGVHVYSPLYFRPPVRRDHLHPET